MNLPEYFHLSTGYVCYRPVSDVTFLQAIDLCSGAVAFARMQKIRWLLIDTTRLSGFGPPGTVDRFEFGDRCARAAGGAVKAAFLAKSEMIDSDGFGLIVARNRGFQTSIFASESDAVQWLLDSNST
jgi:hypothetical protein